MLSPGDLAPDFEYEDVDGQPTSLYDTLASGEVIVYFYPADFSPVCTAQACAIRDNFDDLADLDLDVVGVSPQSGRSHERFRAQFELPFPLLGDVSKKVIRAYGVDGPMGFGVRRATFVVGRDQHIRKRVVADFTTTGHVDLLRETVDELQAGSA